MADVDITSLSVEISAESQGAELNIDKLTTAISNLRTKGSVGKVCTSLDKLSSSISALKQSSAGISGLDKVTNFLNGISSVNTTAGVKSVNSVVNAIKKIPSAVSEANKADYTQLAESCRLLMNGIAPLSVLDFSNLKNFGSVLNSLNKVPDLAQKLDSKTVSDFSTACQKLYDGITPLASQLETVGNAFAKLPPQLSKVVTQANRVTAANERQKKSYMSLSNQLNGFMRSAAKLVSLKAIADYLGNAVAKFNDFYEAANMFGVSMGDMTNEASGFIDKMEQLLGIDPSEAMNAMANIYSMTKSFGLAKEQAYTLSKSLTQLGYDLSSLKNIPISQAFTKIRSAMAGELEPMLQLGVDISQARLQQELLALGFNKQVSTLSQADKATLRYIAILKQTTDAQGDFARTLSSPANMIRVLKAQLSGLARDIGSLLYPALKSILPPLIAAVELIREFVQWVAKLMGVKVEFPDFSSASDAVGGVTDAMDNTTKATGKAAKAFKNYIMGFDELNVIQKDNGSSGGSGSGAGAAGNILGDIDLSGYDMFKQYNEEFAKQIDSIKEKIRGMLPIIGAVTAALALWKLTTFIADIVDAIKKIGILKGMVAGGILIGIGFFLMFDGIKKAIQDKLNAINFSEILVGAITFVGGAALLGSKIAEFITTSFADSAVAKAITAAGGKMGGALVGAVVAGVIAGVAMFVTGVYDALTNGLNILNGLLIPAGSTMAGAAVGAIIGSLGGPIGAGIGAIIGLIVGGLTDAGIAIYQNWDKITAALDKASADLKQWFVGVGEWWDKKWKGFKTNWDKAWNSLADTLKALPKKFWDYGKNVVQGLIDGINNGIENAKKTVGGLAKAILDKFTTDTGIHSPSKVFWGFGGYIVEGLANGISGAKELAENAMQKLSDSVIALGQQLTQENYGMGDANIAMTADGDEGNLEKTAMSLRNVLSNVGGGLSDWLKKIKSSFTDFSDGINAVSDVGKKISQGFTDSISALSNTSKSIVETKKAFKSVFSDMKTYVKSSIAEVENEYHYNGALSAAGLAIQKAFEGAYLALDKVSTAVKSLSGTIDSIKNVVKTFNDLKIKVGEVIDQVPVLKDAYNGLKTFFSNLFGMDSGIVKIVSDGWDLIKTKAGEALTFISGKIKALGVGGASGSSGGLASTLGAIGSTALPAGAGVLGVGAALGLGITGHVQWIKDLKNTWSDSSKSFGEKVFNTVNDTLTDIFNPFGAVIKIAKNKFGFADGGFPDDGQLFLAGESGPEFVGSMGGHTAVANNDQIVEGIREGVESAMAKQNELLRQQNELLKALLEKESTSEISVSSISQAISRVNQRNGKTIIPIGT
nr:MAG TPA: minor tail protein [Caudoviricetes sp.]